MTQQRPYIILASLELDSTADTALSEAARLAGDGEGVELHLVHVIATEPQGSSDQIKRVEHLLEEAPKRIQEHLGHVTFGANATAVVHVRVGTDVAHEVLQAGVDVDADIIIVGTHRRKGLQKLLLGSVAERVLKDAHCPVLVALEKNYESETRSLSIEPPCPDCVAARTASGGEQYWCERHSRKYARPHVYVPSDRGRNSVMPST